MYMLLDTISKRVGQAGLVVASLLIVYMLVHILLEIVLRTFFATSTFSMDEYVGYALCGLAFFALSDTFRERRHIRVNILFGFIGRRTRLVVELLCHVLTFWMMSFLAQYIWRALVRDYTRGSVSPTIMATPLWIIDAVIFTGICMLLLQIFCSFLGILIYGVQEDQSEGVE